MLDLYALRLAANQIVHGPLKNERSNPIVDDKKLQVALALGMLSISSDCSVILMNNGLRELTRENLAECNIPLLK